MNPEKRQRESAGLGGMPLLQEEGAEDEGGCPWSWGGGGS